MEKELEIQYAMLHMSDLIPYDDPDYDNKLRKMAESYVNDLHNPDSELNRISKEHDRMLEEGKIDF